MEHTTEDTIKVEVLKNKLLLKVEQLLLEEDEFLPFGLIQDSEGSFRLLSISDEDEEYTADKAVKSIKAHIDSQVTNVEKVHSGGFCQDFLINDGDAIQLNLISKLSEGWISVYLPYFIQEDRSLTFGSIIMGEPME